MKIAVFVNESNEATTIEQSTKLNVYLKVNHVWREESSIPTSTHILNSLSSIRLFTTQITMELNNCNCNIVVASKLLGASYNIFTRSGYHIWEFEGPPNNFLNIIEREEIIATYELNTTEDPFSHFEELELGIYRIDIKSILFGHSELTSKKLLLPFLDNVTFIELYVTFSHLPPWLEGGLSKRGLERELIKHEIDEHQIVIRKKTCII